MWSAEVEDSSAALGELKSQLLVEDYFVLAVDGDGNCPVRPSYRVKRKCSSFDQNLARATADHACLLHLVQGEGGRKKQVGPLD